MRPQKCAARGERDSTRRHILWARSCRGHSISGRESGILNGLRRNFRADCGPRARRERPMRRAVAVEPAGRLHQRRDRADVGDRLPLSAPAPVAIGAHSRKCRRSRAARPRRRSGAPASASTARRARSRNWPSPLWPARRCACAAPPCRKPSAAFSPAASAPSPLPRLPRLPAAFCGIEKENIT